MTGFLALMIASFVGALIVAFFMLEDHGVLKVPHFGR
jgi:hypothetical protein